ncbi:MAG TPA: class I SAM-dependent methyltransferase [Terracidiphilus sp.]|nr:class I SAM-dependent methyltransferase [Terracidiphilus sp.]
MENQASKPSGWIGRLLLRNMNKRHSGVTDWGLSHIAIPASGAILDIGCGGGRTIAKLAAKSPGAFVFGVDHSADSVKLTSRTNSLLVSTARVEVRLGSVSQIPYPAGKFDLVTAIETHFWWPDLPGDVREVFRIVKPGGRFAIVSEVYRGAGTRMANACEIHAPRIGMTLLTPDEHRPLLSNAGFIDVEIATLPEKGWICATATKPPAL